MTDRERPITRDDALHLLHILRSMSRSRHVAPLALAAAALIASRTDRPDLPYEFQVVNTDVVNAFAVPGGFIYMNRGLLEALERLPPPPEEYRVEGDRE